MTVWDYISLAVVATLYYSVLNKFLKPDVFVMKLAKVLPDLSYDDIEKICKRRMMMDFVSGTFIFFLFFV